MRTYMRKRPKHKLIQDVHDLCRLCLQKSKEQMKIFNDDSPVCPLALRIRMCVGLEVTKEECLSNLICKECFQQLDQIYEFRKKCEMTYRKLKSHMIALKENILYKSVPSQILKLEFYDEKMDDNILEDKLDINEKIVSFKQIQELNVHNGFNNINRNFNEDSGINSTQSVCQFQETENVEAVPPSPEPQLPEQDGVTFTSFLTNLLVKVGVLVLQDDGTLSMPDGGTNTIHLDMGDHSQMTIQLTEEVEHNLAKELKIYISKECNFSSPDTIETSNIIEVLPNESLFTTDNEETKNIEEDIGKYINTDKKPKSEAENTNDRVKSKSGRAVCSKCGKSFSSRGVLNRHLRVHSEERAFLCCVCGRGFSTRSAKDRHRHVHDEKRPFACSLCPKSFTQRENLEQHALSHYEVAARPRQLFHCRDCPKVFMHRSGLSRHTSLCSGGGRQYTCADCNRPFNDRDSLLRHIRTVCPKKKQTVNNANTPQDELATTQNDV